MRYATRELGGTQMNWRDLHSSATIAISTLRKEKIDEMILCEKKNQWCDFFTVKLQARQVVFSLRLRKVEVQFTKVPK